MADQVIINVGNNANDGTGDGIQVAGEKINDNFEELFGRPSVLSDIRVQGTKILTQSSNADIVVEPSGTGNVIMGNIRINDNNIETVRSNDDLKIIPSGSGQVRISEIGFSGTTMTSADSSFININENAIIDGTLNVSGATNFASAVTMSNTLGVTGLTTLSNLITTGSTNFSGTLTIDNLTVNDNTIGSSSNADINLTPGGSGSVNITSLTVDSTIKLFDNSISPITSNANLVLSPSGSGKVEVTSGLTTAAITTTGNVSITGTETIAGQMDVDGVRIIDNKIFSSESNANLQISGNGSGNVVINDVDIGGGAIDNVVVGGTTPAAGTFTTLTFSPVAGGTLSSSGVQITDNTITSTQSNDNLELNANGSGKVVIGGLQLPNADGGTGNMITTNASGVLSFTESGVILASSDIQDAKATVGFASITEIDANTARGDHEAIGQSATVIDSFETSKYDSAWYLVLSRMLSADSTVEYATHKLSVNHGVNNDGSTNDAFISHSSITRTGDPEYFDGSSRIGFDRHIQTSADINAGSVLVKGQAGILADGSTQSTVNALAYYRIGLGDNDSSVTSGNSTTIVYADLDSAQAAIDSWAHASYRGAKYYISVNNTTTGEVSNMEVTVVHNGSDAFMIQYNNHKSGNNELITLTADISGSNVRLLGANGSTGTCRVTMYRILLADDESDVSGTNISVIGEVNVGNTEKTTIDTNSFRGTANPDMATQKTIITHAKTDFDSIWYHMVHKDSTNSDFLMNKYSLVHGTTSDGSTEDAFFTESSIVRSENDRITILAADLDGSNLVIKATGHDDGSTAIENAISYYGIGLGPNTTTGTLGKISTHAGVTIGGNQETTIDVHTRRGTTSNLLQATGTLASFTAGDFDSAWYHLVTKDITHNSFEIKKVSLTHDLQDVYFTESAIVKTDEADAHPVLTTDITTTGDSTASVRIRSTDNDGSSATASNTAAYYKIGLGEDSTDSTSANIKTNNGVTVSGGTDAETIIDHVTATGSVKTAGTGAQTVAQFSSGQFDGALYYVVSNDTVHGSIQTSKVSVMHDMTNAFVTDSSVTRTDESDAHPTYDADVSASDDSSAVVRLKASDQDGSTVNPANGISYYRVGLGDDDSTGYVGELGLMHDIMHVDIIDSTVVTLDQISHGAHVGAKYFINVKNQNTGETSNIEALLTHDGTNAYVTSYNEHFSGNNSLITLTADINGGSFRLRASSTAGDSTKVIVNRIIAFGDSESDETNSDSTRKIIGNVIVSSSATEFDTFMSSETDAAHYVITGQKGSDENFICEAVVVTDGTSVFVSQGPNVSTKENDMLAITATISSGVITVKASSTSGSSTVQAYAVKLKAPTDALTTVDSFTHGDNKGAKYYISLHNTETGEHGNLEALVVHDGSDAYITTYNEFQTSSPAMAIFTAEISGSNCLLRASPNRGGVVVKFYRILLNHNESDSTGTDFNTVGAVTISSSSTAIDTFVDTSYDGAHYILLAHNASEGATSICEATVLTDGTNAFITQGPMVSSKGSDQVILTAAHDGSSTVTLSGTSTSGGSTSVTAHRIHLKAPTDQKTTVDTFAHASNRGAKYYISCEDLSTGDHQNIEAYVVHDGSDSYLLDLNEVNTNAKLFTITADLVGSNVRLRAEGESSGANLLMKFYKIMLGDSESGAVAADTAVIGASTISSSATAIDTFAHTSFTGAHYIIVSNNASEGTSQIMEATVVTNGTDAFVSEGPYVSSKETPQLLLTAAHDGSNTVTLSAASTSGGSTTVNAFRIHMLREDGFPYTVLDSFSSDTYQGAHYFIVGKNADNQSQALELTAVTDGVGAYHTDTGINISTHSTTSPLMTFTTGYKNGKLELRAENSIQNTNTITNLYRVHLARGDGDTSGVKVLDTFSASTYRSAKYHVSISDKTNGRFELLDLNLVHDGTNCFLTTYANVGNHTSLLVSFSAEIVSGEVTLKGTISNTESHELILIRRVLNV